MTELQIFKDADLDIIRGKDIISITEDWHKAMGWNEGYKLTELDYADIRKKGIDRQYAGLLSQAKDNVNHYINSGQTHLIGKKPLEIKQLSGGVKSIGQIIND